MNSNENNRDYSLGSEVLHELGRINDSVSESLTILTSKLDGELSPFFLIPYIIEHFVWGDSTRSNVFKKRNAYLLFLWEALETLRVSVLLALGFRYATGLTLLRQSLETLIRGAFVDTIAQKEYRSKKAVKSLKISQFLDNLFAQMLEEEPSLEKDMEISSSALAQALQKYQMEKGSWRKLPSLSHMITALETLGFFEPAKSGEVYDVYGILSWPVHIVSPFTDVIIQITHFDEAFNELRLVPKMVEQYLNLLGTVVDLALVLSFNLLRREHRDEFVHAFVEKIHRDESIHIEKCPIFQELCDSFT